MCQQLIAFLKERESIRTIEWLKEKVIKETDVMREGSGMEAGCGRGIANDEKKAGISLSWMRKDPKRLVDNMTFFSKH